MVLRAGRLHDLFPLFGRIFLGPAKHHVLEQVGETGPPGLDFIARADLDDDVERNDIGIAGSDRDQPEAVGEIIDLVGVGENLVLPRAAAGGQQQQGC